MEELKIEHRRYKILNSGDPITEADISDLESKVGTKLPLQLRAFYLRRNGGLPYPLDIPQNEAVWVSLLWKNGAKAASVGRETNFRGMLLINGHPARDFYQTWTDFRHRIPIDCLPFGRDSGGSIFLIGTKPHNLGKVYFWERTYEANIEEGEIPGYQNVADVAKTFNDFLLALHEEPKD